MVSRQRLFNIIVLLIAGTLLLAACERPTPGREDESTIDSGEVVTDAGTESLEDPNVGGGTDGTSTDEVQETTEEPVTEENAETPRTDEEAAADTGGETDQTDEASATDETVDETADGTADETADQATEDPESEDTQAEEPATDTTESPAERPSAHTVAAGENLYQIGLKYSISWKALAEHNGITNPNRIQVGQEIKLPSAEPSESPTPTPTPSPLTETTYTIKAGDNLFRIGLAYGISWVQIAEANGLVNPNQIIVGDLLKIPVSAPGPSPQFTHQVKQGETLFKISLQYGVTWNAIATENNIEAPYIIYVGQTLSVPGK
ncbi:MAG: LysM peptidoglycan-binding domain-containing protein [Chloroflexi bacterium]|nr:LysM peptidoglycan-binding domain-containing protein [Chloroflexota bacterium]